MIDHWSDAMSRLVRIEMQRLGWSYVDLHEAMQSAGFQAESAKALANRTARGTFTAAFLVQTLIAMGVREVRLDGREIADAVRLSQERHGAP